MGTSNYMGVSMKSDMSYVFVLHTWYVFMTGRQFVVEVDPLSLQSGAHYAEVSATYCNTH